MRPENRSRTPLVAVVIVGAATVGAVYVLSRANPDSSLRRYVDGLESTARNLPVMARTVVQDAKVRFAEAKVAFVEARTESERSLLAQLQEAKQRGSLPPA